MKYVHRPGCLSPPTSVDNPFRMTGLHPTQVTQEEVYWYHPLVEELAIMHELVALGKLTIF